MKKLEIEPSSSLNDRTNTLSQIIDDYPIDNAYIHTAIESIPELLENGTENQFYKVISAAVRNNNLELLKWLEANCPGCAYEHTGHFIFHDLFENGRDPWRAMNADTFQHLYEQGAAKFYLDQSDNHSLVVRTASYWIPEKGGVYSDYSVNSDDNELYDYRCEQRLKKLTYLFSQGHSVDETEGSRSITAFSNAADCRDSLLMEFLKENGADTKAGTNPLGSVTGTTEPDFVREIVGLGYDPTKPAKSAYSSPNSNVLLARIVEGQRAFNPELMNLVDEFKLDVNQVDQHGNTALNYAAYEYGQQEQPFTDFLISKGANKDNSYFNAVLLESIKKNNHSNVKEILKLKPGLATNSVEEISKNPLHQVVNGKDFEMFELLLAKGVTVPEEPEQAYTILTVALFRSNYEMARRLLKEFPSLPPNSIVDGKNGELEISRPLIEASESGDIELVQLLLDKGASLVGETFYETPIVKSALANHHDITKLLLEAGSEPNPATQDKSLIDWVKEHCDAAMLELIESYTK